MTILAQVVPGNTCAQAPPGIDAYAKLLIGWAKYGVLAMICLAFFVSIGLLVWARQANHPKGARYGMDGIVVSVVAAILFAAGWAVVASIAGRGC